MAIRSDYPALAARLLAVAALGWFFWTLLYQGRWMEAARRRRRATHAACEVVAGALRQYRIDHGHYPPSLELLVPQYLRTLPRDGWSHPLFYAQWQALPGADEGYELASGGADGRLDPAVQELFAVPADQPQRVNAAALSIVNGFVQHSASDRRPWYEHVDDDIVYGGMSYLLDQPPVDDAVIPPFLRRHTAVNTAAALVVLAAAVVFDFLRFRRRQEIVT